MDPLAAGQAQVAAFVRDLASRPGVRGENVLSIDSGAGLANATLQQRLVPVRLFMTISWRASGSPIRSGAAVIPRVAGSAVSGASAPDDAAAVDSR